MFRFPPPSFAELARDEQEAVSKRRARNRRARNRSTGAPDDDLTAAEQREVRHGRRGSLKLKLLPAPTLGGAFTGRRRKTTKYDPSGVTVVDVDGLEPSIATHVRNRAPLAQVSSPPRQTQDTKPGGASVRVEQFAKMPPGPFIASADAVPRRGAEPVTGTEAQLGITIEKRGSLAVRINLVLEHQDLVWIHAIWRRCPAEMKHPLHELVVSWRRPQFP